MKKAKDLLIKNRKIISILLALFTAVAVNIQLGLTATDIKSALKIDYLRTIITFVITGVLLLKTLFKSKNEKNGIYKKLLAVLLTAFTLFGVSYNMTNSWDLLFANGFQFVKAFVNGLGIYIICNSIINYVFDNLIPKIQYKPWKNKVFNFCFEKHAFIIPFVIIIMLWIPYIFAYYPGLIMEDSREQIKQYFGYDVVGATDSVKLIDENVKITNHHPVAHTVLLGTSVQIGRFIGNDNFGVFIYTIIQVLALAGSFAYIIKYMKKLNTPNYIRIFTLLIFALLPVFPFYAIKITKDTLFTAIFIVYIMQIYDMFLKAKKGTKYKAKDIIKLLVIMLLVCILRNNGLYNIILSFPLLAIIDKTNRKKILLITFSVICIYKSYTNILFPVLKITNSSVREMLSIPFQQTARYVKENESNVTDEEKKAIDKLLNYETLSQRYSPTKADNVKNKFNKNYEKDDLKNYFGVWFAQFRKSPTTYMQATINNVYGYFYPGCPARSYIASFSIDYAKELKQNSIIDYHYNKYRKLRKNINKMLKLLEETPIISLVINIGFNTWLILGMVTYLLYKKKYKYIVCFTPILSILLVCCASPVNAYFRYAMPYLFAMPLLISIFLNIFQKEVKKEKSMDKEDCDKIQYKYNNSKVGQMKSFINIIKEHKEYKHQIFKLAKADLTKTYRGAALGWSWAIIKPTVTIFVYWFAFTIGLRMGGNVGKFPYFLWLISGVVPWFYMSDMITGGADSIRKYSYLVTKMKFPISTIPTFVNISKFIVHLFLMAIVVAIFMMFGFKPDIYLLQLPFYMAIMFVFFNLWSLFASLLAAISKDFLNLVRAFVTAVFWLSGIIWNADTVTIPWLRRFLNLNPVTFIVNGYRNCFINKIWFWEQPKRIVYVVIFTAIMLILALWSYRKLRKEIPDVL